MDIAADEGPIRPVHALMSGLIDYAGLFPPAGLSMTQCVENYAAYVAGADAWMLGRFILQASRLEEFRKAAAVHLPRNPDAEPWPLSVLIDGETEADLEDVFAFNREHAPDRASKNGLALIDAVEIKLPGAGGSTAEFIEDTLNSLPEELYAFFEVPSDDGADVRGCVAALAGADAGAKIRTGGVVPEAIPSARRVAEFVGACAAADVPFKATAGLHHALRGERALSYDPQSPRAMLHGFVNVFFGACALLTARIDPDQLESILGETDARAFEFGEHALSWRGLRLDVAQIVRGREQLALSFGSCSFEEPVREIRTLAGA